MSPCLFARLDRRVGRRDFLRTGFAFGGALALNAYAPLNARATSERKRVVIIGAGLAGLACADELTRAGHQALVLEARSRVGGRVRSLRNLPPGASVEAGGEFIGQNHQHWLRYAGRFHLELERNATPELPLPVEVGGEIVTGADQQVLHAQLAHAHARLEALALPINEDEPWNSPDAAELDRADCAHWIDAQEISALAKRALHQDWVSTNGVATSRMSLLAQLAQIKGGGLARYWTDSEIYRCRGGNQRLAEHLTLELGERVQLSNAVKRIEHGADRILVETASGRRLYADAVVLAVPPSTWNLMEFVPALPGDLAPQMGTSRKWLALVRHFWRGRKAVESLHSDSGDMVIWEATASQPALESSVLTAFLSGPTSDDWAALEPVAREAHLTQHLEERLPGFRSAQRSTRWIDWPRDRWTRAGYSFAAPGQLMRTGARLRDGLGRLFFAGEHTSTRFPGYMEGALESGVRAAKAVSARTPAARTRGAI